MSSPDKNFLSFTGDEAGNVWLDGSLTFTADQPGIREYVISGDRVPPDLSYSDTLKFSGVRRLRVIVEGNIVGGSEDCIDVNRHCQDLEVLVLGGLYARGKFVATIKGGSLRITIRGRVVAHGTEVDFDCGNISEQSDDETQTIELDVICSETITWRQLNASGITLRPGQPFRRIFKIRGGEFRSLFSKIALLWKKVAKFFVRFGWATLFSLAALGCGTESPPANPSSSTILGRRVDDARAAVDDRIAGNVAGIVRTAAELPPDSRERQVIGLFTDDILRLTGPAKPETVTEFERIAAQLVSVDLSARLRAERELQSKQIESSQLRADLDKLRADHAAAMARERTEWQARVDNARLEGELKVKRLQSLVFYGGGALLIAFGVATFFLASQLPFLGPWVSVGLGAAGGALIFVGRLLAEFEKHPWLFWTTAGTAVAATAVAAGLAISNQYHAREKTAH